MRVLTSDTLIPYFKRVKHNISIGTDLAYARTET